MCTGLCGCEIVTAARAHHALSLKRNSRNLPPFCSMPDICLRKIRARFGCGLEGQDRYMVST